MVNGIVIPADDSRPLFSAKFESLEDYQRAVGGWIEAVDIPDLGVTMYVNEEGLIRDLPINRRATFLWWFHVPLARGNARLVGDVVLVGMPDELGASTDLLPRIRSHLLKPGSYRVWTRGAGEDCWCPEPVERDDYLETIIWATLLMEVSPGTKVRIERVEDPDVGVRLP